MSKGRTGLVFVSEMLGLKLLQNTTVENRIRFVIKRSPVHEAPATMGYGEGQKLDVRSVTPIFTESPFL